MSLSRSSPLTFGRPDSLSRMGLLTFEAGDCTRAEESRLEAERWLDRLA
jgi:hypothetical protein